jgi:hypothetical protein
MISPPNPAEVPTIPYENLFRLPLSDRLRPPAQQRARGLLSGQLPRVLWAVGYGPNLLDTIGSLQRHMAGEPCTPYQETTLPLQVERQAHKSKKN